MTNQPERPITVFTGYLGAGKTTIITHLLEQVERPERFVWLKNEYGNATIDSNLVKETKVQVKEVINGCLCCILIGRLGDALVEVVKAYNPERIIIETSGSAYPGPIALEIRKFNDLVRLDAMVNVVDVLNFPGYVDKSFTAKLQTKYTDLIILNKHENVDERRLDKVLDDVYELNPNTPKVKSDHGWVAANLIFGVTSRADYGQNQPSDSRHNFELERIEFSSKVQLSLEQIRNYLGSLSGENIYRLKGVFKTSEEPILVNYVAGRYDIRILSDSVEQTTCLILGERLKQELPKLLTAMKLDLSQVVTSFR